MASRVPSSSLREQVRAKREAVEAAALAIARGQEDVDGPAAHAARGQRSTQGGGRDHAGPAVDRIEEGGCIQGGRGLAGLHARVGELIAAAEEGSLCGRDGPWREVSAERAIRALQL